MHQTWKEEYLKLSSFVADSTEIKISSTVTRIPENCRDEFFALFEKVRIAFVIERFPELLNKAELLRHHYSREKNQLTSMLKLEKVTLNGSLELFLSDPMKRFIHDIHTPLMDLLKGSITEEEFETISDNSLETDFITLYNAGYDKWTMLALSRILGADSLHQVVLEEAAEEEIYGSIGFVGRYVPAPQIATVLSFERPVEVKFIVPDLIIHSQVAERYIALRSEVKWALVVATNPSETIDWMERKPLGDIDPNIILLYSNQNPENLRLVTDRLNIARPEIIIQSVALPHNYSIEKYEKLKLLHEQLNPVSGTFLAFNDEIPAFISAEPVIEEPSLQPAGNSNLPPLDRFRKIHILNTGFDESGIKCIVDALAVQADRGAGTEAGANPEKTSDNTTEQ
ncbi:MAG: hypothetical protein JW954_06330 [Dehalococcoidaceae bacterium]|nr:hypothetical protein [Dehalococcoidaceae bacterium]